MSTRTYPRIANALRIFHLFWVLLLMGGAALAAWWPPYRPINLAILTTTVVSQVLWLGCPLVALEQHCRGETCGTGSFVCGLIEHYTGVVVKPWMIAAQLGALFVIQLVYYLA